MTNPTDCKECGTTFDLSRQPYFTDICPGCLGYDNDKATTGL